MKWKRNGGINETDSYLDSECKYYISITFLYIDKDISIGKYYLFSNLGFRLQVEYDYMNS